tara:strand:- start:277 stop:480 length:204 start_codon:yes stop_codon:yes gene_type:complete
MAKIQLNGGEYTIKSEKNLEDFLKELEITPNKVAIELNGEIAQRKMFKNIKIKEGDKIELVQFIGGG